MPLIFQEARATFRELLCESTLKIDALAKKLGSCIDKSRPYYDSRFKAKEVRTSKVNKKKCANTMITIYFMCHSHLQLSLTLNQWDEIKQIK